MIYLRMVMKVLVIQGANVNMWEGYREANERVLAHASKLGLEVEIFHSNSEGEVVDAIQRASKGEAAAILINPGDFRHSYPIRGALDMVKGKIPAIEVHIFNLYAKGGPTVLGPVVKGVISGFGAESYILGLEAAANLING